MYFKPNNQREPVISAFSNPTAVPDRQVVGAASLHLVGAFGRSPADIYCTHYHCNSYTIYGVSLIIHTSSSQSIEMQFLLRRY